MDRVWQYLPRVIRRSEWLILTISEEMCSSCGNQPEDHKWALLASFTDKPDKILYCNISAQEIV